MNETMILTRGEQRAEIAAHGATLVAYSVGGRDVVVPIAPEDPHSGMHGAVLAPWPNRLDAGRYSFDGVELEVPITEPDRNNAIHGFVHGMEWKLERIDEASLAATVTIEDAPGYPFVVELEMRYELDDEGLRVTTTATNAGETDAPFGIGFHPWLAPGAAAVDECTLAVDATAWIEPDERLLPVAVHEPIPAEYDFASARSMKGVVFDDGFAGAVRDGEGRSWIRLASADGYAASVWSLAPLDFWQVCTGDFSALGRLERAGVAAEPMSCPTNALASGDHVTCLKPGQKQSFAWGLRLEPIA